MRLLTDCAALSLGLTLAACSASTSNVDAQSNASPNIPMTRSSAVRDEAPDIDPASYASFVSETNAFGLDLFHAMAEDDNTFLSPASTLIALAMTYGGARGNTAQQMAAAMHSTLEPTVFHAAVNQLTLDLQSRNIAQHDTEEGQKNLRLSPVNGVFAQQGYGFLDDYLDLLSVNYDAGIYQMDFMGDPLGSRDSINAWVAFHTENRIDELLGMDAVDPTTCLVLVNALYFYGSWMHAFDAQATADSTFHTLAGTDVTVPTMHGSFSVPYGQGDGYEIVDLPYDGGKVHMSIVLPEAGRFEEIRSGMTADWLETARAGMTVDQNVSLAMPKFSFTWGTKSFVDVLTSLGMEDAFVGGAADFSGMDGTKDLFIQDVLHQAFVGVDEGGTEAAAATAVVVGRFSAAESEVTVDRPFVFLITDETDTTLFVGQVTDPSIEG